MTVDVEDYFQVSAFESAISRDDWISLPCRVEHNVDRILQLFDGQGVKATFFTLGWMAERYPSMVRRIAESGHEVGSHGYSHVRATEQTSAQFRDDVTRTRVLLQDISAQPINGYRAASFSIGAGNLWTLDELAEAGYLYSSSINPICHDLYGMPRAPRFAFQPGHRTLLEVPITTIHIAGQNIPCGGGGYFRLLPYRYFRWALRRVNSDDREAAVFYFHPWEIDPDQPRQENISLKIRFRHYTNLRHMEQRLKKLLSEFRWGRMDEVFLKRQNVPVVDLFAQAAVG
ncbi:MAG: DUF3473 domain-containing protein [Gammaproteobacteria bacterium]|nr:DUF3473 domain-containing protein [Gammaproteobacteria bacterium]